MAEARIPVDLFNPGQVFACLGFLEASEILLGSARGGFDWSDESDVRFALVVPGDACPVRTTIQFLRNAEVRSVAPFGSGLATEGWGVPTRELSSEANEFPFPAPTSPATLPAVLEHDGKKIVMKHWGEDPSVTGLDNSKFWAGAGGYPGAALAKDAIELVRIQPEEKLFSDPFNVPAPQSSSFRFDWRRDYIPLEIGFSLNAHSSGRFNTIGYPLVELLAAIGLTNARPKRPDRSSKLEYEYGAISLDADGTGIDPAFVRAALGVAPVPFDLRVFTMNLDWPGQEGQARCITTVEEITNQTQTEP
jgi:CRISPR-associated protein Csx14